MDHETIHYDSSVILTSDDVADAVIEYAAALSGGDRADTVEVPAVAPDGTMTTTKILIGPASELLVEDADEDEDEEEDELEADHTQRTRCAAEQPPPGDRYGIPRSWLLRRTLGSFPAMLTGLRSSIGHLAPSLVCTTATR